MRKLAENLRRSCIPENRKTCDDFCSIFRCHYQIVELRRLCSSWFLLLWRLNLFCVCFNASGIFGPPTKKIKFSQIIFFILPEKSQHSSSEKGTERTDPVDMFRHVHSSGELRKEKIVDNITCHVEKFVDRFQFHSHGCSNDS